MKKRLLLPLLLLLAPLAAQAGICCPCPVEVHVPKHFWYLSGAFSFGWHGDTETCDFCTEHTTGIGGTGAFGFKCNNWRVEIEGSKRRYRNDDLIVDSVHIGDCGHIKHVALMLNGYYDFCLSRCFSLYLGGGIGIDRTEILTDHTKDADTVFAWQAKTGLTYKLSHSWEMYTGYTFFAATKPEFFNQKVSDIPYSNNIDVGLRVFF